MIAITLIMGMIFLLYFGYRIDYKANKTEFLSTVLGVLGLMTGFILIASFNTTLALLFVLCYATIAKLVKDKLLPQK